jgi:hypothetical protein
MENEKATGNVEKVDMGFGGLLSVVYRLCSHSARGFL